TVFQLLYQAEYLTLLTSGWVGIPNHDVFEDFIQLSLKIYARSSLPVDFSDHTLRRLGLGHGDIFAFVRYMDELYLQRSPVSSANLAEGGRMDIRIKLVHDNKSTVWPYIVFELKQLSDSRNIKL
ncbi:hypothetical protein GGI13_002635, partial [Coemansia sp. RSA 455]